MISRSEWVGVASGLRYALVHGCLSEKPIPFDEPELRNRIREAVHRDMAERLRDWVLFKDQAVVYGGVLWTGDVVNSYRLGPSMVGTMNLFNGVLILTLVHVDGKWAVSSASLAPEVK